MKKLLVITSFFLPSQNVGAVRPTKFVKYLPDFGWQPIVLTPRRGQPSLTAAVPTPIYTATFPDPDKIFALGRRFLPRSTPALKTRLDTPPPVNIGSRKQVIIDWLFLPDEEVTWIPFAIHKGLQLARQYQFNAVLATAQHFSSLLIGLFLSRRLKCPWIADFRDPWVTNSFTYFPTPLHRQMHTILERQVVRAANRVVTVSEPIRQDFITRYPDQPPDKFKIIYNGYDSADFSQLPNGRPPSGGLIHIVHSGSFYPGREPLPFLQAVKLLAPASLNKIRITFVGTNALELKPAVEQLGLHKIVLLQDHVPYQQNLEYLAQAAILLVIPGLGQGSLTTKLFEYLKLGKFVLALTPSYNSAIHEVLTKANVGVTVDPESPLEIAAGLTHLIDMVESGLNPQPNWAYIEQFDRKNLTGQLAGLLNELA